MIKADLVAKHRLVRAFEITTHEGRFLVTYDGQGSGYEQILVNNEVVRKKNTTWWYAPEFKFSVGSIPSVIYVRVWAWLAIRSFSLEIGNQRIYFED